MSTVWQLQEAKNRLSEVVQLAQTEGPQEITRHGKKTAVLIAFRDYRKLGKKKGTLREFFHRSPLRGLSFDRTKDYPREVRL